MPVYLTLQPIRRAAHHVAMVSGGLLPHLFTLTADCEAVRRLFLSRYSTVADSSPLGSMALCVARTFLTPPMTSVSDGLSGPIFCYIYPRMMPRLELRTNSIISSRSFGGRQFGLDTLYGVADVHARKVQVAVSVLYFADYIVREVAAAKSY